MNATTNEFYGIGLYQLQDGRVSDNGYIRCLMQGSYVGNQNVSFLIDVYGRSKPDLATKYQSAGKDIFMIQTYAVIERITPNVVSVNGGANITIHGRNFDQTDANAIVLVGEVACSPLTFHNSSMMTCITPVKPAGTAADKQPGKVTKLTSLKTGITSNRFNGIAEMEGLTFQSEDEV
ncbi:fibrocystin-L-like [Pecten maximus]|uniref:fibrocystin-L-like n=1 Tax=Pecten maximus TaxID=6579 RepID=UPI00145897BD|nr:fibrocystin-L-like [Pecten maximus]